MYETVGDRAPHTAHLRNAFCPTVGILIPHHRDIQSPRTSDRNPLSVTPLGNKSEPVVSLFCRVWEWPVLDRMCEETVPPFKGDPFIVLMSAAESCFTFPSALVPPACGKRMIYIGFCSPASSWSTKSSYFFPCILPKRQDQDYTSHIVDQPKHKAHERCNAWSTAMRPPSSCGQHPREGNLFCERTAQPLGDSPAPWDSSLGACSACQCLAI